MAFFDPLTIAAAVTGGSNVAGGVIGNLINQNFQENEATRNQSNFNMTQDNFLRNTQIRVEDAKKAGIHPLYALGANAPGPSGSQPIVMQDQVGQSIAQGGQSVGNIISRQASADDRMKMILENKLLDSQIGETDARKQLLLSEAAKNAQAGQSGLGVQPEATGFIGPEGQAPNPPGTAFIEKKPAGVTSQMEGRQDIIAGLSRGGWEVRNMGKGFPMVMPVAEGESPMELWSEMAWYDKIGLINRNVNEFGTGWFDDFVAVMYLGKDAKNTYDTSKMRVRKSKVLPERKEKRAPTEKQIFEELLKRKRG